MADPGHIRLSEHVTQLRASNGGAFPSGNPLRVDAGGTTVLLDAAIGTDFTGVDLVLLSHFHEDHVVGVGASGVPAAVHSSDFAGTRSWDEFRGLVGYPPGDWEAEMRQEFSWAPISDAQTFEHGATFDVGGSVTITVIGLPGHTAGHCGFLVEPDGVLFLADVDLSSFGPFYADRFGSLIDTRSSLDTVASIDASVYAPYHHKGPYTDRRAFLDDLAVHAEMLDKREGRLLQLLDDDPSRLEDLVGHGVVYRPGRRPWFADLAEGSICGKHLDDLVDRGIVEGPDDGGRYSLS